MDQFVRPGGLNHVAYVTRDTAATRSFYTDVLGMRLIGHAEAESVESTLEPSHFLHTFFEMADGSCIAFFDIEGLGEEAMVSRLPRWAPHLALSVGSDAELQSARERLIANGLEVIGPVDHEGIWSSIYFFDPNGIRLELTHQRRSLTARDAAAAASAVDRWTRERAT